MTAQLSSAVLQVKWPPGPRLLKLTSRFAPPNPDAVEHVVDDGDRRSATGEEKAIGSVSVACTASSAWLSISPSAAATTASARPACAERRWSRSE